MTMDLTGPAGDFGFTNTAWEHLLRLASLAGWQPAGTLPPEGAGDWDGNYFTNDGQRVGDEDARGLAEALERALPDVPDHDALGDKAFYHPALPGVRLVDARTPVNSFEWFAGQKDVLKRFIAFCRAGGFEIR
jgi:hypothetical protein